jgi:hypothetical protein
MLDIIEFELPLPADFAKQYKTNSLSVALQNLYILMI